MLMETLRKVAGANSNESNMRSVSLSLVAFGTDVGLNKPHRLAHYLAQLLHESGRFRYDTEVWGPTPAQKRYEDRADLGHSAAVPNEAHTFRGRSGIQVTGRNNYRRFTQWVRSTVEPEAPDFEAKPDLLNTDPWEGLGPIWYWSVGNPTGQSLNSYADENNIEAITRKVNGGLNGFQDRTNWFTKAALVLIGYGPAEVMRFQTDVGFTGRDVDGISGQKTRGALFSVLTSMPAIEFASETAQVDEVDFSREISEVTELAAMLHSRLAKLEGKK